MARPGRRPRKALGNTLSEGPFWRILVQEHDFPARCDMKGPVPMAETRKTGFGPIEASAGGVLIVLADDNLRFGPRTRAVLGTVTDLIGRAAKGDRFTGKSGSVLDIVAPAGLKAARLLVIGTGKATD